MGKLYKLRKAIEKDPERWVRSFGAEYIARRPYWIKQGTPWYPRWEPKKWYDGILSYRDFVQSVLREIILGQ